MFEDSFVIVDLETTGLSPKNGEIIEIGAIKVVNNKVVDKMDVFVKPSRPITWFTTNLTGITNEMVDEGLSTKEALKVFDEFSSGLRLMAHNAKFDMSFLNTYMQKELGKGVRDDSMDTLLLSRAILKDVPNHKLGTLADYFGIDYTGAHRALKDCEITLDVYNGLRRKFDGEVDKVDNIGLKRGALELYEYDNNYHEIYLKEKQELEILFSGKYTLIEHVGSTAIKGIKSKPIIDILLATDDIEKFIEYVKNMYSEVLEKKGYTLKEENRGEEFLIRKEEDGKVKAFIHVLPSTSKEVEEYIIFRDYMNSNPKEAKAYEALKEELLIKYKDDRPSYTEGKNNFIKSIIKKAEK